MSRKVHLLTSPYSPWPIQIYIPGQPNCFIVCDKFDLADDYSGPAVRNKRLVVALCIVTHAGNNLLLLGVLA